MILLVVTCASRGSHYLRSLLDQIETGGWKGPGFVVSDGPLPWITGWTAAASPECVGQMRTFWRALALGMERAKALGSDRISILEDDVELCRNALPYMERTALPAALDFVTWFDGHALPAGARPGIHPVPARRFVCLQAITWKLATAEFLLRCPEAARWSEPHRADLLISQVLADGRYGVHAPNLVQHRGTESICNPGEPLVGARTAANYPGRDFDALTLCR